VGGVEDLKQKEKPERGDHGRTGESKQKSGGEWAPRGSGNLATRSGYDGAHTEKMLRRRGRGDSRCSEYAGRPSGPWHRPKDQKTLEWSLKKRGKQFSQREGARGVLAPPAGAGHGRSASKEERTWLSDLASTTAR